MVTLLGALASALLGLLAKDPGEAASQQASGSASQQNRLGAWALIALLLPLPFVGGCSATTVAQNIVNWVSSVAERFDGDGLGRSAACTGRCSGICHSDDWVRRGVESAFSTGEGLLGQPLGEQFGAATESDCDTGAAGEYRNVASGEDYESGEPTTCIGDDSGRGNCCDRDFGAGAIGLK